MTKTKTAASLLLFSACTIQLPTLENADDGSEGGSNASPSSEGMVPSSSDGEEGGFTSSGAASGEVDSSGEEGSGSTSEGTSICGNGIYEPGEDCDDGPLNGQQYNCRHDCTSMACNDGILDSPWEECDPATEGNGSCPQNCQLAFCGDFLIWEGHETCDDGNVEDGDGCDASCQTEEGEGGESSGEESSGEGEIGVCGDGVHNLGEACDDGPNGSQLCNPDCTLPSCGDGFLDPMAGETCDDGNLDPTDACSECKLSSCGDGYLWEGMEECDDGNLDQTDWCAVCKPAVCGDGFVRYSWEECDDANDISGDGCSDCIIEKDACGDPVVDGSVWLLFDWTAATQVKLPKVTVSDGYPSDWAPINKIIPSVHTSLDVLLNTNLGKAAKVRFNETMEFKLNLSPILSYDHATACVESWRIAGESSLTWFGVLELNPLGAYGQ